LLLDEPSANDLIDRRFDEGRADRLALPVPLAEVRDEVLVVPNAGKKIYKVGNCGSAKRSSR